MVSGSEPSDEGGGAETCQLLVSGRPAQRAQRKLGVNAVTHLGRLLAAVEARDVALRAAPEPGLRGDHRGPGSIACLAFELVDGDPMGRPRHLAHTSPGMSDDVVLPAGVAGPFRRP